MATRGDGAKAQGAKTPEKVAVKAAKAYDKAAEKAPAKPRAQAAAKAPAKATSRTAAKAATPAAVASVPAAPPASASAAPARAAPVAPPAAAPQADRIAKAYDQIPYQSKPFPQSTPEQLAAMARLFKLNAPPIATARVLELGCSAGGNLIPLAVRYPKLKAVGIDISNVEIEQGKIQLVKLGIENCELHCLDIAKAAERFAGPFDYIIAHGVFSWVPAHVREAMLALIRDRLAPDGVAYVSYNVYPGWKMREVIRDMMMYHAGGLADPARQLGQAKAILEYTKNLAGENSTYGKMLRDEAALMSRVTDDYLMHEHLSHENSPMYFRDFIQLASDHQLAYLGEAQLGDMAPQRLGSAVYDTLATLSAGNILATEQYMDFFTNRVFRQTLLVHHAKVSQVDRSIRPEQLNGMWFSTQLRADPDFKGAEGVLSQFVDGGGRTLTVRGAVPHAVLHALVKAKPYPVSVDEMVAACRAEPSLAAATDAALRGSIGSELLNLLLQNMVRMHLEPLPVPRQLDKPKAWPLARVQAESGQNWATNPLHQSVALSIGHRALLALMNGQRDHDALRAALAAMFRDGRLSAMRANERITDEAQLQELAAVFLTQGIGDLSQLALLV